MSQQDRPCAPEHQQGPRRASNKHQQDRPLTPEHQQGPQRAPKHQRGRPHALEHQRRRPRAPKRQQDRPLTPEQMEIVNWAASLGAITAEALALRLGVTLASARARLNVVQRRGLLLREAPLVGHPALFAPTRAGLRVCDVRGIQACKVSSSNANHLSVCAEVAAALERCYPHHRLSGERELRRDEREHGGPLASAQLGTPGGGKSGLHRPDLVLWPTGCDGGMPVVVEVELTLKASHRLLGICRAWARCRTVAGVLYLAPANVERALSRAIAQERAGEQIVVLPLNALPGVRSSREEAHE
jgi:DNA-binding CsgD family transcriptional regulator